MRPIDDNNEYSEQTDMKVRNGAKVGCGIAAVFLIAALLGVTIAPHTPPSVATPVPTMGLATMPPILTATPTRGVHAAPTATPTRGLHPAPTGTPTKAPKPIGTSIPPIPTLPNPVPSARPSAPAPVPTK